MNDNVSEATWVEEWKKISDVRELEESENKCMESLNCQASESIRNTRKAILSSICQRVTQMNG